MKLFYFEAPGGLRNFGDDLNPWLWERILPGLLDEDDSVMFVGLGTLLNDKLPRAAQTVVFGSGVGYGAGLPVVDDSWTVYCVRGPLSAKALGLSPDAAVTDGALLLRTVFRPSGRKTSRFAFMPHAVYAQTGSASWKALCEALGFSYIDPRRPVEEVLTAIGETEVLFTEAMHGAIVADALRTPWVPVVTSPEILSFKWQDWCATMGVSYEPVAIRQLYDDPAPSLSARMRALGKMQLVRFRLARFAKTVQPKLSDDRRVDKLTVELQVRLERFKKDVRDGRFLKTAKTG